MTFKTLLFPLLAFPFLLPQLTAAERRRGRFSDSGVYAIAYQWGGTLNAKRLSVDKTLDIQSLKTARERGVFTVIQFEEPSRWQGDPEATEAVLREWLENNEDALPLIDALHFWEENPYNAARWLNPLYDIVKEYSDLPVYVWYSMPLGPGGAKADGYCYDFYGQDYTSTRKKVIDYLSTGKPLVMCIDASGFSNLKAAREQVMVCKEFDIPAFYFAADGGTGSCNNWLYGYKPPYIPRRNFMFSAMEFQRRSRGDHPLTSADFVWGDPVEVVPDSQGNIELSWQGAGGATIYGFTRLTGAVKDLRTNGQNIVLDYQFWSRWPVRSASLELAIEGNAEHIQVEQARYGMAGPLDSYPDPWRTVGPEPAVEDASLHFDLGDTGHESRVRITLSGPSGAVTLKHATLAGKTEIPENPVILLDPWFDGWRGGIRYRQDLTSGQWRVLGRIDKPQLLEAGKTPAMKGVSGYGRGVEIVQAFSAHCPLDNIVVRLAGESLGNLGGSFDLGISLDGQTIVAEGTRSPSPNGQPPSRGTYTADLSDNTMFSGIKQFYVHMIQRNSSGIESNIGSRLKRLEIDARFRSDK
ncbi:MAG: hypothetical protein K9N51_05070 [Candidatus Pacebacteria bacterium]|nr:hypothetical protein [Candidatus Paceibacterota bacterium]